MDNPETEYSLSQRKKSGPYHHNIQVIITFRLMFNLPGRYLTTSTHESWALAIQNRSRFPQGTVFFLVPRRPPSASSMPIFSLEGPAPPHPFSYVKHFLFSIPSWNITCFLRLFWIPFCFHAQLSVLSGMPTPSHLCSLECTFYNVFQIPLPRCLSSLKLGVPRDRNCLIHLSPH